MIDYYKVLGVDKNATDEQIKTSYRELAKKYHPDVGGDPEKMKEVNAAYTVLSDPQERAAYDRPKNQAPPFPFPPGFGGGFNPFQGFNFSFGGIHGGGVNINNMFSQQIISVNAEMTIEQMLLGGELETDSPSGRIKFPIPPMTPPGKAFPIRINRGDNQNQQIILQVRVALKMPASLTEEQKKKIKDLGL